MNPQIFSVLLVQGSQKCDIFKKDLTWKPGVDIQKNDQASICTKEPENPIKGLKGQ